MLTFYNNNNITFFLIIIIIYIKLINCQFKIQILHTNDMHAHFEQFDEFNTACNENEISANSCFGGFPRLKFAVDKLKEEAKNDNNISTLFLNAGDTYQGTPYYTFLKWNVTQTLVNMLGLDVMCLGNHEFDDHVEGLVPFLQMVRVPHVCCNLNLDATPELKLPILTPSVVLEVGGEKIGVIGYLSPITMEISHTDNLTIYDEIPKIREEAEKLKSNGIDIIIALGHSGLEKDIEIAQAIPELSIVIGGHTHSFMYTPRDKPPSKEIPVDDYPHIVKHSSGKKTPVVQAYAYTKYLGRLVLEFDRNGNVIGYTGSPILLDTSFGQDKEILDEVLKWKEKIDSRISEHVGKSNVLLRGGSDYKCRMRECNFPNFITDSMVDYAAEIYEGNDGWTNAPVAVIHSGSMRTSLNRGDLVYGDLITALPFYEPVYKVGIKGSLLMQLLEHSVRGLSLSNSISVAPQFLHYSGIRVTYDINLPKGKRIKNAEIRCDNCPYPSYSAMNASEVYTVLMPEYLFRGGDGYSELKDTRNIIFYEKIGIRITDSVARYMKKRATVYPGVEGRIKIITTSAATSIKLSAFFTFILIWHFSIFLKQ